MKQIQTKKELVKNINRLSECIKKRKKDSMFHAAFIFSGISLDFHKLKSKYNLDKEEGNMSISPNVYTKQNILKKLEDMRRIVNQCKMASLFRVSFTVDELDFRFMELARQYNIDKELEAKHKQESKDNI